MAEITMAREVGIFLHCIPEHPERSTKGPIVHRHARESSLSRPSMSNKAYSILGNELASDAVWVWTSVMFAIPGRFYLAVVPCSARLRSDGCGSSLVASSLYVRTCRLSSRNYEPNSESWNDDSLEAGHDRLMATAGRTVGGCKLSRSCP